MNKEPQPYKDFDLSTEHLNGRAYIPPFTRNETERQRRHLLPPGTIILEQQRRGLAISVALLERITEPQDLQFAARMIAMGAINSSWYLYGEHAPVMRRRLNLPELASAESDWRQDTQGLLVKTRHDLVSATELAEATVATHINRASTQKIRSQLGRRVGNASLGLASLEVGTTAQSLSAFAVQARARQEGLQLIEDARTLGDRTGTHPSIAQLADPDSDLAVLWRREAPNEAYTAFEWATEEVA